MLFDSSNKPVALVLYIHMPTGETEMISNPNISEKLRYIEKTYNDDLVHSNCDQIWIDDFKVLCQRDIEEEHERQVGNAFDFGVALALVKNGGCVSRKDWDNPNTYIFLFETDDDGVKIYEYDNTEYPIRPFIMLKDVDDSLTPWNPNYEDLLASDWIQV